MSILLDPEEDESRALFQVAGDLAGLSVLEVGSGDGRLTWRYARQAANVTGIDPNPEKIARARQEMPGELAGRVTFLASGLEEYAEQAGRPGRTRGSAPTGGGAPGQIPETRNPGIVEVNEVKYTPPFDRVLLAWSL